MQDPAPCGSFAWCICTTGNFEPGGPAADGCHEKLGGVFDRRCSEELPLSFRRVTLTRVRIMRDELGDA